MRRIVSLTFFIIMSVASIFAKSDKIKFGKFCFYEGTTVKVEKQKFPMGKGTFVVKSATQKDGELVRIEGVFSDNRVTDAKVTYNNGFIFSGDIEYQYIGIGQKELKNQEERIFITLVTGNLTCPFLSDTLSLDRPSKKFFINIMVDEKNENVEYPTDLLISFSYSHFIKFGGTYDTKYRGILKLKFDRYSIEESTREGKISYQNGDVFIGRINVNDHIEVGEYTDRFGNCYNGSFDNFKLNSGQLTMSNGDRYYGKFVGNASQLSKAQIINGEIIEKNGNTWTGEWKNGSFYSGKVDVKNDSVEMSGEWKNGTFYNGTTKGKVDGGLYSGEWKNGTFVKGECKTDSFNFIESHIPFSGNVSDDTLSGHFVFGDLLFDGTFVSYKQVGDGTFSLYDKSYGNYSGTITTLKDRKIVTISNEGGITHSVELSEFDELGTGYIRKEIQKHIIRTNTDLEKANRVFSGNTYWGIYEWESIFNTNKANADALVFIDLLKKIGTLCIKIDFLSDFKVHSKMYIDTSRRETGENLLDLYVGLNSLSSSYSDRKRATNFMVAMYASEIKKFENEKDLYYMLKGDSLYLFNDQLLEQPEAYELILDGNGLKGNKAAVEAILMKQ